MIGTLRNAGDLRIERRLGEWRPVAGMMGLACGLAIASSALAQPGWTARAQASGGNGYTGYAQCGSSDHQVDCNQINGIASGSVTYANGGATVTASGDWSNAQNAPPGDPSATATGTVTADLTHATIRQSDGNNLAQSGTAGLLKDNLTFALPDAGTVYEIPFAYRFEGDLSGASGSLPDINGTYYYHPGLYAQSYLGLGSGSISSTQSIGESGLPVYSPPDTGLSNGAGQWTNVVVTQSAYGYSISGDVLIGGGWGDQLGFDMQSQVSCGDSYGQATCDFGHTQAFDFGQLPPGVSFTSDSGVFLIADTVPAAPEPSTWLLMVGGVAGLGLALRARRKAPRPLTA